LRDVSRGTCTHVANHNTERVFRIAHASIAEQILKRFTDTGPVMQPASSGYEDPRMESDERFALSQSILLEKLDQRGFEFDSGNA
jgi:hypothetical protein